MPENRQFIRSTHSPVEVAAILEENEAVLLLGGINFLIGTGITLAFMISLRPETPGLLLLQLLNPVLCMGWVAWYGPRTAGQSPGLYGDALSCGAIPRSEVRKRLGPIGRVIFDRKFRA